MRTPPLLLSAIISFAVLSRAGGQPATEPVLVPPTPASGSEAPAATPTVVPSESVATPPTAAVPTAEAAKPASTTQSSSVQSTSAAVVTADSSPPATTEADLAIKNAEAPGGLATKARDSAGKDTLSVDFPDEDIRTILRNVADLFELNIIIPESLQGKTSIKLRDVTWRQIFQNVLAPVGFTYVEDGNIIKIVSNDSLQQEPVSTEVFILSYAKASDVKPSIEGLVEGAVGGKILVDARSNSLIITERPSRMNRIRPVLEQLDRATDQVMIETKFVEVTDRDIRDLGVNWASLSAYNISAGPFSQSYAAGGSRVSSNIAGGTNINVPNQQNGYNAASTIAGAPIGPPYTVDPTTGIRTYSGLGPTSTDTQTFSNDITRAVTAVFNAEQFQVVLSALQSKNGTKIVSNPTVVTLNNTEASINVGEEYPIPNYSYNDQRGSFEVSGFTYKPIGIILKVTPQVNARGFIKLTVAPEVSQQNGTTTFGGAGGAAIPIIATRRATTQISLKDGYTMGIGGLISSSNAAGESKVPLLGNIPGLGYLFKQKTKDNTSTNLLIFITAKSINAEGAPVEQIFDSRQIRSMGLTRDELPGFRDGSDPFTQAPTPSEKKK